MMGRVFVMRARALLAFCLPAACLPAACLLAAANAAAGSECFGTVGKGRLTGAVQLPAKGDNFVAYSSVGITMGRTWLHADVRDIAVDAYAALARSTPNVVYEYGETGLAGGGRMRPHRTHQSGTSVDFMVPVRNRKGVSIPLPASATKQFGYGWEFDDAGRAGELQIDFDAMAEHLLELKLAAERHHIAIEKVIFDPRLTVLLLRTRRGPELARTLPFMRQKPWIRHDEHYHVDFAVPCRPL